MNKNEETKKEKLSNRDICLIVGGALYSTVLIGGGYIAGEKVKAHKFSLGLDHCFDVDPTLQTHMNDVIAKVWDKK